MAFPSDAVWPKSRQNFTYLLLGDSYEEKHGNQQQQERPQSKVLESVAQRTLARGVIAIQCPRQSQPIYPPTRQSGVAE